MDYYECFLYSRKSAGMKNKGFNFPTGVTFQEGVLETGVLWGGDDCRLKTPTEIDGVGLAKCHSQGS